MFRNILGKEFRFCKLDFTDGSTPKMYGASSGERVNSTLVPVSILY